MKIQNDKNKQVGFDQIRMTIQLDECISLYKPVTITRNGIEFEAYIPVTSEDIRGINTELDALMDNGWEIIDIFPHEVDLRYSIK